eukprot:jgi/Mesvir1/29725/Mv00956-RA.1
MADRHGDQNDRKRKAIQEEDEGYSTSEPAKRNAQDDNDAPVLIACFNYKGGVGKTTMAINLAFSLRALGCRTCLVDCDPQCNLSTFFTKQDHPTTLEALLNIDDNDGDEEVTVNRGAGRPNLSSFEPRARDHVVGLPIEVAQQGNFDRDGRPFPMTLKTVLEKAHKGDPTPTDILEFATKKDSNGELEYPSFLRGMFLLPGHSELPAFLEHKLVQAMSTIFSPGCEDSYMVVGGFRKAMLDIARHHRIKFMVCDLGPSSGNMNQNMLASCDIIVPPFEPSLFSASSVHGLLHNVLPRMCSLQENIVRTQERRYFPEKYAAYKFNPRAPKLAPFLMTNFNVTRGQLGGMDSSFLYLVRDIAALNTIDPEVKALFEPDGDGNMVVPFLKHVPHILKTAQERGEPAVVFEPPAIHEYFHPHGGPPNGIFTELRQVKRRFQQLAQQVISMCGYRF